MTKQIVGCSFDGLKDRCFVAGEKSPLGDEFYLADVVLPDHYGGYLLVGHQAERSRVSTGMIWPPEAQVGMGPEQALRRIPVSWAWRLLVDAKDRKFVTWSAGRALSFSLAKVLAVHIAGRLKELRQDPDEVILAIPNDLDEFGQDALLRELADVGVGKPKLVWRPVAAAIAWLDKVQNQLPQKLNKNDFILVIHLGPDCIEFTTFQLREKTVDNKRFVLPLRISDQKRSPLSGCDWAAELVQQMLGKEDLGAFWQVFTGFPEVWQSLAQISWDENSLPRVWSQNGEWSLWNPGPSWRESLWQLPSRTSGILKELTSENCTVKRDDCNYKSWAEAIQNGIKDTLAACPAGQLWGVILSGPLMSLNPDLWIKPLVPLFQERGLNPMIVSTPMVNTIWCPEHGSDIISEGAAIYGQRLVQNKPTYLDVLTQLSILARDRGGNRVWIPLLKELEIEGGKLYTNRIAGNFILSKGHKNLRAYLKRGDLIKETTFLFPDPPENDVLLDTRIQMSSAGGLAQVELVPADSSYLLGETVFLNYLHMKDTSKLPEEELSFPPVIDFSIDFTDRKILGAHFQESLAFFLKAEIKQQACREILEKLRAFIVNQNNFVDSSGAWVTGRLFNKDGKAGTARGQRIITEITAKFESDFKRLDRENLYHLKIFSKLLNVATWLFGAAPETVIAYLNRQLKSGMGSSQRTIVEGAGRCFVQKGDMSLLYVAAIDRIASDAMNKFPIQWERAIWRILALREEAPYLMNRDQAERFVREATNVLGWCIENERYNIKFRQTVLLLTYLLRYRIVDGTFLSENNMEDKPIVNTILTFVGQSKNYLVNRRLTRYKKCGELILELEKYIYCRGSTNIIKMALENEMSGEDQRSEDSDA